MKFIVTLFSIALLMTFSVQALPKSAIEEFYVLGFEDALTGQAQPSFPKEKVMKVVARHLGMPLLSNGVIFNLQQSYSAGFTQGSSYQNLLKKDRQWNWLLVIV